MVPILSISTRALNKIVSPTKKLSMSSFLAKVSQNITKYGAKGTLISIIKHDIPPLVLGLVNSVKGGRSAYILAALSVAGFLVARLYWKVLRKPSYLRGLPCIPLEYSIKCMFQNTKLIDRVNTDYELVCKDALKRGMIDSLEKHPPIPMWAEWRMGKWQVIIANPTDLKDFYISNEKFEKAMQALPMFAADKFVGHNVALVRTPQWKAHRKIINPSFRRGWATSLFHEPTVNLLARFDEFAITKQPIDVPMWMKRVTIDVLSSIILGMKFDSINDPDSKLIRAYDRIMERVADPALNVFGGNVLRLSKGTKEYLKDLEEFNGFVYEWIDNKTAEINNRKGTSDEPENIDTYDLLELLVSAQLQDPDSFSREDLRSNLAVFFVAGHETTASALTAAIYELGMHPEVQEKARKEAIGIMGDTQSMDLENITLASKTDQNEMRYLTCVLKECLRLYGGATVLTRELMSDHTFASTGLHVPKGTMVAANRWSIHRQNGIWEKDQDVFWPERWDEITPADEPIPLHTSAHNFTWAPFGGGPRICIGQQFSIVEQRIVLSALLLRYTWKVVGNKAALGGMPDTLPQPPICFQNILVELVPRHS